MVSHNCPLWPISERATKFCFPKDLGGSTGGSIVSLQAERTESLGKIHSPTNR